MYKWHYHCCGYWVWFSEKCSCGNTLKAESIWNPSLGSDIEAMEEE